MAKENGKSEKANKTREQSVRIDEDDDEETLKVTKAKAAKVEVADTDDDADDEGAQDAANVKEAPAAASRANANEEDLVTIAMFVTVDPAPTIGAPSHGGYSFVENGIMKLSARENYTVPRRVAEHLVDKQLANYAQ
jgi:hypothetical protein